jgi:hypothetical protein
MNRQQQSLRQGNVRFRRLENVADASPGAENQGLAGERVFQVSGVYSLGIAS